MDQRPNLHRQHANHARDLMRGSVAAAVSKTATTAIGFGFNIVLTRQLGVSQSGIFFITLALITVAGVLSRLGFEKSIIKYASRSIALSDWPALKVIYLHSIKVVALTSALASGILFVCGTWLAHSVFQKPDMAPVIPLMAVGILPLSMLNLHCQFIKSVRFIGTGFFLQNSSISLLVLIALLMLPAINSAMSVAVAYSIATLVSFAFVVWLWFSLSQLNTVKSAPDLDHIEFSKSSDSLYIVSIMNQVILPWGSLILLGIWGTQEDAGQFAIVQRLAMLINFAYLAIESATGPKFAALFATNDYEGVRFIAGRATLLITIFATPVALIFFLLPVHVLTWFGPGFEGGVTALIVLTIGQLFNALTGSVANLLVMSGNEKDFRNATIFAGIVNLVLSVLFIPYIGVEGAAWATACAVASLNLLSLWLVRQRLGFLPLPRWNG